MKNDNKVARKLVTQYRHETVVWQDAARRDGQIHPDDIVAAPLQVASGILAKEDESMVAIAAEGTPECGEFRDVLMIPKSLIVARFKMRIDKEVINNGKLVGTTEAN